MASECCITMIYVTTPCILEILSVEAGIDSVVDLDVTAKVVDLEVSAWVNVDVSLDVEPWTRVTKVDCDGAVVEVLSVVTSVDWEVEPDGTLTVVNLVVPAGVKVGVSLDVDPWPRVTKVDCEGAVVEVLSVITSVDWEVEPDVTFTVVDLVVPAGVKVAVTLDVDPWPRVTRVVCEGEAVLADVLLSVKLIWLVIKKLEIIANKRKFRKVSFSSNDFNDEYPSIRYFFFLPLLLF